VPVSISDIRDAKTFAALFAADSNYGRWHEPVSATDDAIVIGGRTIAYINSSSELPDWARLGVDVVIDCTARATVRSGAQAHLDRGARKVLVSAASKTKADCDAMILPGINQESYQADRHHIVSMASCTTNALAPVVKVLRDNFGIESGLFSTVHAYTNTQSLADQPMQDRRDSWAAAENVIPSSSGAAKALIFIWEDLQMTGKAYRVPVRTGSIAEVNAILKRPVKREDIVKAFEDAAKQKSFQGVMDLLTDEWASARIVGDPHSCIIDVPLINIIGGRLVSVASWYDNEMGYATQLAKMATFLAR
jgi:glyceraldehyde 3-phosphate dehydrogenase